MVGKCRRGPIIKDQDSSCLDTGLGMRLNSAGESRTGLRKGGEGDNAQPEPFFSLCLGHHCAGPDTGQKERRDVDQMTTALLPFNATAPGSNPAP